MRRDDPRLLDLGYLESLRHREVRDRDGVFLVEGVRFVATAFDRGADVLSLAVCPRVLTSPVGQMISRRRRQRGWPCLRLSPDQLDRLSNLSEPQGIAAVVRTRFSPLPARPPPGCYLGFGAVRNPGNLGSALRTAVATGVRGVVFLDPATDPYDPRAVRSTMGATFAVPFHRSDPERLGRWARRGRVVVVGTSVDGACEYRDLRRAHRTLLMMGSERGGLTEAQRALCDQLVRIPMEPGVDSLNLSVATGVVLYELYRRRRARRGRR